MLQRVARRVAARAVVAHDLLQAQVVGGLGGQSGQDEIAGQLPHLLLAVLDLASAKSWRAPAVRSTSEVAVSKLSACAQTRYLPAGSGGK